jgi:hypothetical protein
MIEHTAARNANDNLTLLCSVKPSLSQKALSGKDMVMWTTMREHCKKKRP